MLMSGLWVLWAEQKLPRNGDMPRLLDYMDWTTSLKSKKTWQPKSWTTASKTSFIASELFICQVQAEAIHAL